jgi:hypothetical protein
MTFMHVFPGSVQTNILLSAQGVLRPLAWIIYVFTYPFQISKEDCAEYMLSALFGGGKGALRRGKTGDNIEERGHFISDEARKKLWEHTVEVVGTTV